MSATAVASAAGFPAMREALPRFPTSAGILLGIALCAHLAAGVQAILGTAIVAAVYFIGGQFALSLALLRLYNGRWIFQDIRVPLVVFMFLYGFALPAVSLWRPRGQPGLTEAAFLYATAFLAFNLVQWWHKQPWRDVPVEAFAWVRPTFANAALVTLGFLAIVAYAWSRGTRTFLTFDRSQMSWLYTQTWVVSMMIMTGFVMYMFAGWPRLSRNAKRVVAVTLVAFVIFHLGLGNRRDFLAMFIFLFGMLASRRRATIGIRTISLGMFAFVLFMFLGVFRQIRSAPWMLQYISIPVLIAEQNEFVMPIQTVMYYVSSDKPLKYGATYLAAPGAFVPRAFWEEKPLSLSLQFNRDKFGDALVPGYAYTPITEAYINFSFVGPFIVMGLVSLATVYLVRNARRRPLLYFLCFSLAFEFSRGDSAGVLYLMSVVGVAFALMKFVSRIQWAPKPLRGMWPPVTPSQALGRGGEAS